MGHREDLLAGATRCLYEKGYAQTTARDIVAASGTNLASIGYHYGSKDTLMSAALFQVVEECATELTAALSGPGGTGQERFVQAWQRLLESFGARRELWAAVLDVLAQADRVPQLRQAVAEKLQDGRVAWATLLSTVDDPVGGQDAPAAGALCQALLSGVLVQWLLDPQRAPSAGDLVVAVRAVAAAFAPPDTP